MAKLMSVAVLALLALACMSSCNRGKAICDNIVQLQSRPVVLPCDSMRIISHENRVDTFPKPFYWVVYSDSVDCSACRLTNLLHWAILSIRSGALRIVLVFVSSFPLRTETWALSCVLPER